MSRHPLESPRWDLYNTANTARGPRALTLRAVEALSDARSRGLDGRSRGLDGVLSETVTPGQPCGPGTDPPGTPAATTALRGARAVELGSGSGVDARYLESVGLEVHSYDAEPGSRGGRYHRIADLGAVERLPSSSLVLSNSTLSFLSPPRARRLLGVAVRALDADGVLAVDFFGPRDEWAPGPGTYPSVAELRRWLASMVDEAWSSPEIGEGEWAGPSFSGPKHWHVVTVLGHR